MASAPRKIFKLPSMCAMTKPTRTMPVTAITTFLPTMVLDNVAAGLLGHTWRDLVTGSDLGRSATVPSSNWVVICCLQLLWSSLCGESLLVVRLGSRLQLAISLCRDPGAHV